MAGRGAARIAAAPAESQAVKTAVAVVPVVAVVEVAMAAAPADRVHVAVVSVMVAQVIAIAPMTGEAVEVRMVARSATIVDVRRVVATSSPPSGARVSTSR